MTTATAAPSGSIAGTSRVSLLDIFPNPWNPHRRTEQEQNELIQSIREDGQWRPITVVEMDVGDEKTPTPPAKYRIVDGEHLWRALCTLHTEGVFPEHAAVMILGKNSEIDIAKQVDIGQTVNHGLRGSQEDPVKTQEATALMLTRRSPEQVARRLNIGTAGVRHLAEPPTRTARTTTPPAKSGVGLGSAVKSTPYAERKMHTLALLFNNANESKEFESSLEKFAPLLDPNMDYTNKRGQRRLDLIRIAIKQASLVSTVLGAS